MQLLPYMLPVSRRRRSRLLPRGRFISQAETRAAQTDLNGAAKERIAAWFDSMRSQAADNLQRRLGWMTRAHPFILDQQRLIVPL